MKKTALLLVFLITFGICVTAAEAEVDVLQKFFVYSISAEEDRRIAITELLKQTQGKRGDFSRAGELAELVGLTEAEGKRIIEIYTTRSVENMNGILDVILFGVRRTPYTEYMPNITKELNRLIIGDETDNRGIDYMYTLLALYNFSTIFGGDSRIASAYPGLPGLVRLKLSEEIPADIVKRISGAIDLMPTLKERLSSYEGANSLEKMMACAEEIANKYDTPEIYHFRLGMQELGVAWDTADSVMTNRLIEGLPFRDLDNCRWAHTQIRELTVQGAINGTGKYTYSPDDMITREQFVKIITEAFDITAEEKEMSFDDVNEAAWYYPYVKKAYSAGIITGQSEKSFGTGNPITREQMAAMLYRICEKNNITLKKDKNVEFADHKQIADFASEAVTVMASAGIINGMGEGKFMPKNNATRAQAAVMIYNVIAQ